VTLDAELLEILVCPNDRGELDYQQDPEILVCRTCGYRYPVRDGIPVMLIDEGEAVSDDEHDRLMAKAEAEGIGPNWDDSNA
jgi:uncharacterized protein YbaR (Trm112 family)